MTAGLTQASGTTTQAITVDASTTGAKTLTASLGYTTNDTNGSNCAKTNFANITVNATPVIFNYATSTCSGTAFTVSPVNGAPTAATIVPAGTTYGWAAPVVTGGITGGSAVASGAASVSQTLANPTNVNQTATYTVTPTKGTCAGVTFTVNVAPLHIAGV